MSATIHSNPALHVIHRFKSKSEPDVTHKVHVHEDGRVSCTCKGFRYGRKCWHTAQYEIVSAATTQEEKETSMKTQAASPKTTSLTAWQATEPSRRKLVRHYLKKECAKFRSGPFAYEFETAKQAATVAGTLLKKFSVKLNPKRGSLDVSNEG